MYNKIQMGIEGNKKQKEGTILMKEIRTEDAVGHILCHDITQIIKDVKKGVLFKKGHIVREEVTLCRKRTFICVGEERRNPS